MENKLFEKELEREYVFKGRIFDAALCRAELPDGTKVNREVICHSGGVCVLPLEEDGTVTMVRQFRYGVQDVTLEIPAGKLDYVGEDFCEAALRELREETGAVASEMIDMGDYFGSPAIMGEHIRMFMAKGLTFGETELDEGEFLEVFKVPLSEAVEMVLRGEITDGKTQVAILRAAMMLK